MSHFASGTSINVGRDGDGQEDGDGDPLLLEDPPTHHDQTRLLDRSGMFGQSNGRMNIQRVGVVRWLKVFDWFHSAIYLSTWKLLLIFASVNILSWLVIARLLMASSDSCGLALGNYREAVTLAMMTMSTIGMGLRNDPYLDGWCVFHELQHRNQ